jgi:hypothetical protein
LFLYIFACFSFFFLLLLFSFLPFSSFLLQPFKQMTTTDKEAKVRLTRGTHETELMRQTIKEQVDRLFTQLEDLEEFKNGGLFLADFDFPV